MTKRVNYLNNREILKQLHNSKMSFCYIEDKKYFYYDNIVDDLSEMTQDKIKETLENKEKRLIYAKYEDAVKLWEKENNRSKLKPKLSQFSVTQEEIDSTPLVIRVMCLDHIPISPRKKNPKNEIDKHIRCNFPPFKHYALENSVWREVVRSHWDGDLETGTFSLIKGKVNDRLGKMMMMLVDRYAMRANFRGYTYLEEMKGNALLQLSKFGLYFDESKSSNPFSYFTTTINNAFLGVLNNEKKVQNIRDDLLQDNGYMPSYTRQFSDEKNQQDARKLDYEARIMEEQKNLGING
jgi:hypothetical protein